MKQEMKWGAAAVMAFAVTVGISSRSNSGPREGVPATRRTGQNGIQSKTGTKAAPSSCQELIELFQNFLLVGGVPAPDSCHGASPDKSKGADFNPKIIIATLPDPLHTHFALLFDRFVEAVQQGAQDEGYEYDSSWLPWETEEPTLVRLADQDEADDRKKDREDQPGVLLFRKFSPVIRENPRSPYQQGLIIFIVGEEPTGGIHRAQFGNAVAWITALQKPGSTPAPVAILGPTFSGSFSSLAELLANDKVDIGQGLNGASDHPLAIYSGSTTSKDDGRRFSSTPGIVFHSFLQDDDTNLDLFCRYLERGRSFEEQKEDMEKVAVLSEDETAYGYRDPNTADKPRTRGCADDATWLYYPRDISTLRAAYQSQSIFSSGSSTKQDQDAQRKNLSTDLADPANKEHDTVRTYAGNQTPLSQEAELLGIVEALRSHRAQYVLIRSSNTLDPLFLANFLGRDYPEARVVILNSDLLFQRGQDALQLSGVMTLSTYPLFPWEREWTARAPSFAHSHRVFPESSTEGTYIASRLLLQSPMFSDSPACTLWGAEVFLPSLYCQPDAGSVPIPDYAPAFWTQPSSCEAGDSNASCKPAAWLSVITKKGSWPLAVLNHDTLTRPVQAEYIREASPDLQVSIAAKPADSPWPAMPLTMKLFLVALVGLSLFHGCCCRYASFTAKPAFRAHFAMFGARHCLLILIGSFLIALMALIAGWGCGSFTWSPGLFPKTAAVRYLVFLVWVITGASMVSNVFVTRNLNENAANRQRGCHSDARFRRLVISLFTLFLFLLGAAFLAWVFPLEHAGVLANRALVYWRAMNLTSGVSPIAPFLFLTLGLYLWFWYSLHGLALFGPDRPRLPLREKLIITIEDKDENKARDRQLDVLPMFSQECAAKPAEDAAVPLAWRYLGLSLFLFLFFLAIVFLVVGELPVRSLGARTYAWIFCLWLDFCFSIIIAEAWQLWSTWNQLRRLLVFLDRLTLRRTLGALHGFSWGTVWKMSGNVLDVRYKLVSRQLECLNHLHASLQEFLTADRERQNNEFKDIRDCLTAVEENQKAGLDFATWYSNSYRNARAAGLQLFEQFQKQIAATAGLMLTHLLVPAWRKEKPSLILSEAPSGDLQERNQSVPLSPQEYIRNAEELVCLTYLGFVQNMLGRIRTMVIGALCLFVATTLSVAAYPFDPRPALSAVLLVLFLGFGAVVVSVYADMHKDATLSHVTNTNPGELGSEFWFKLLGYGAAPVLGLITTVLPDLPGFLFSWLQPGLSSLK